MSNKYTGKLVFLESLHKDNYWYSGEYLVVRESPNALYALKTGGGYDSHEIRQFPLMGEKKFTVLNVTDGTEALKFLLTNLPEFIAEGKGPKPRWIQSVYSDAQAVLNQLKQLQSPEGRQFTVRDVEKYGNELVIRISLV